MRHAVRIVGWVLCAAGVVPVQALGFGADGHRITGYIAEAELSAQARLELEAILGPHDLADLALAADERRAEFQERWPDSPRWHYDDRLVCHPDLSVAEYCPGGACASAAIGRFRAILADRTAPREERAMAVLFLVHILGDIHQPLHAADNNDRGGNAVRVVLPGEQGTRSLHAAWDVDFVRLALKGRSPKEAEQAWRRRYAGDFARWRSGSQDTWMQESFALATKVTYGELPDWNCDTPPHEVVRLSAQYVEHVVALMPAQLAKAGIRIATVLNEALTPPPPRP